MTETAHDTTAPSESATSAESTDPAERGHLDIDRAVLRKIAEHAANHATGDVRARRRIAGVGLGEHGASARLAGSERHLRIRLDLAVHYPSPVGRTVSAVREQVHEELERIAGCRVRAIEVTVSALVPESRAPRVE
ncbi:putative alkaline shock family protein YloU [Saccharopolyspora lacisalsi]|uniref:Putative alkaline shock family protein YloU n=1 Tax=Halosaccharopolyspora lacisalsi TaxID=1000566 RepID=A0A839DXX2_9PSEU|nr:Asp23/Gls24 family envelope stress response protein [Halosaccharopolyspora lacisalsi]MBA8825720.1 putative alkaline shock family protein YloU [Halosaccharopolyspora lacisalsi]